MQGSQIAETHVSYPQAQQIAQLEEEAKQVGGMAVFRPGPWQSRANKMSKFKGFRSVTRFGLFSISVLTLAACDTGLELPFGQTAASSANSPDLTRPAADAQANPDGAEIEAPDVFFLEETGLWDGRPSLGGVWVAHPDVTDPERVLVTNLDNGQSVVGALFRRERDNHGPEIMVSSDAAAAMNVIAGTPTEFTIVALRRQEVPEELDLAVPPPEPAAADTEEAPEGTALPATIAASTLETAPEAVPAATEAAPEPTLDVAAIAESAIAVSASPAPAPVATLDAADILADTTAIAASIPAELLSDETPTEPPAAVEEVAAIATTALPAPDPVAAPETVEAAFEPAEVEELTRPFIQVGIFSLEENAETVAAELRRGGVIPTVYDQSNEDRALWRVVVGPVRNGEERAALLETVQGLGYEDAYFVTN